MGTPGDWRMTATEANGQPAAMVWFHDEPFGVAVLTVAEDGIVAITLFADPKLTERFTPSSVVHGAGDGNAMVHSGAGAGADITIESTPST